MSNLAGSQSDCTLGGATKRGMILLQHATLHCTIVLPRLLVLARREYLHDIDDVEEDGHTVIFCVTEAHLLIWGGLRWRVQELVLAA